MQRLAEEYYFKKFTSNVFIFERVLVFKTQSSQFITQRKFISTRMFFFQFISTETTF